MSQPSVTSGRGYFFFGDIALAVAFAVICFVALNLGTGRLLVAVVGAVLVFAVVAVGHFLIWGRALSHGASAAAGFRSPAAQAGPAADQYTVALNETERLELIRALEQSKAATLLTESNLRDLLDRLRGFGA